MLLALKVNVKFSRLLPKCSLMQETNLHNHARHYWLFCIRRYQNTSGGISHQGNHFQTNQSILINLGGTMVVNHVNSLHTSLCAVNSLIMSYTYLQHGDLAPTINGVHPTIWAAWIAEHTWAAACLPSRVRRPRSSEANSTTNHRSRAYTGSPTA